MVGRGLTLAILAITTEFLKDNKIKEAPITDLTVAP